MNGDQRGVGLAIVRVVDVDDVLPLVVVDDVHDGLVVVGPQAQRVIRRSRCGRQNLLGCFFLFQLLKVILIPITVLKPNLT